MSIRNLIAGIALLSVAATAQAGWVAVLPESASVTLIFVALAVIAFAVRRTPSRSPARPTDASHVANDRTAGEPGPAMPPASDRQPQLRSADASRP